jgi:hypothetical protein
VTSAAGYTGNYAGHVGATLAFMAGLFDSPNANNYKASNVWDVIPADVVVNDILAAAAAVSAGLTRAVTATPTRDGRLLESAYPSSNSSSSNSSSQEKLEGLTWRSSKRNSSSKTSSGPMSLQPFNAAAAAQQDTPKQQQQRDQVQQQQEEQQQQPLLIVHIGSSTLYPLTIMESWNYGIEAYGAWDTGLRLCRGCAEPLTVDHEPNPALAAKYVAWTGWKVWAVAKVLR